MFVNASNNAVAKLSSNINSSQTSLTVDDASIFPDAPFLVTVNNNRHNMEIMRVTNVGGNTLTVQRAQEGTTAQSHEAGSIVENNFTAGTYRTLVDEVNKSIRVVDSEIGDDYILKKYSDGTFELKGHVKRTESLTRGVNDMHRTGNLENELTPIMDDSYKLIYSNAWIMDGNVNSFLVTSFTSNPLDDKAIRYRIMGNISSPVEDEDFIIGYEAYGTWK